MKRNHFSLCFNNKRGTEDESSQSKHIIYWILILIVVIAIWFIVNGIIKKLLTLY